MWSNKLHEPVAVFVVAVIPDTPESCLEAMCGNECDRRNNLHSPDADIDIILPSILWWFSVLKLF